MKSVSFGRAIKVNGTIESARKIAKSANSAIPLSRLDIFSKSVFPDTHISKAKVVAFEPDEIYIFSGKEAQKRNKILSDLKKEINFNNVMLDTLEKHEADEKDRHKLIRKMYGDIYIAICQIKKMYENGNCGRSKSVLGVKTKQADNLITGSRSVIDKVTYTSKKGSKTEKIEYKR